MKIVGIIAEYNPFHRGHQYHIEKARELTGADAVIVVMSGDYIQRGAPAIMPKYLRARMALACGADVVLELPVCCAAGSAEYFAAGAVRILNDLGCVDSLCFGSECGDLGLLEDIAKVFCEEPQDFKDSLQSYLKSGHSFPAARKLALAGYLNAADDQIYKVLDSPNNILGIEYLKALTALKSPIKPVTIARAGAGYHDQTLGHLMSSASAIRTALKTCQGNLEKIQAEIPEPCKEMFTEAYQTRFPVYPDDFSLLLKAKLMTESRESLMQYLDVSTEIAGRIISCRNAFLTFSQFCDLIKTKNITYTRASRCLIHILLGIRKCDVERQAEAPGCSDVKLLGFRTDASWVLSSIKKHAALHLITKLPKADDLKSPSLSQTIYASDLYESVITDKYHTAFLSEYQKQIIRI